MKSLVPTATVFLAIGIGITCCQKAVLGAPTIDLDGFMDGQRIYLDEVYVDGWVTDSTDIVEITCNGEQLGVPPGNHLYFGYTWGPLKSGTNTLQIQARNALDQTSEITLRVLREMRPDLDPGQRLCILINDFEAVGKVSNSSLGARFRIEIQRALMARDRFHVVASKKDLAAVLTERELADSRLRAPDRALRTADMMIEGHFLEYEDLYVLDVSVFNVQDGRMLIETTLAPLDRSPDSLSRLAHALVLKLEQMFPVVQGTITNVTPTILCSLSREDGIRAGTQVVVFRTSSEPFQATEGRTVGSPHYPIGTMTVSHVGRDSCTLRPDPNMKEQPKVDDIVVTK